MTRAQPRIIERHVLLPGLQSVMSFDWLSRAPGRQDDWSRVWVCDLRIGFSGQDGESVNLSALRNARMPRVLSAENLRRGSMVV